MKNSILNSVYTLTYSIIILGAVMMGMASMYAPVGEPVIFKIIGAIIGISALIQIVLSLQGYRMCHIE
ncbi:MAG: hypothetical protein A2Y25_05800 [Candidatus Melainabacteria bacterium GWF2_37_15]|nr:MAG: hypothetical protein A2Y25_05800 [Candidatus Melainabacteria bacterium GWF2_37_15]